MVFRSKVDWWIAAITLGIPGAVIALDFTQAPRHGLHGMAASWFVVPTLAALALFLFPIRYAIVNRTIVIRGGLIQWRMGAFGIDAIDSVRPTHNPLSAPALSIDRLRIDLQSGGMALISPKDRAGFLRALSTLDPALKPDGAGLLRQR